MAELPVAAQKTLARAGAFGERAVGFARMVLATLVLARFAAIGGLGRAAGGAVDACIEIGVLVFVIGASLLLLRFRPPLAPWVMLASVALDAAGCHLALLADVLFAQDGYEGLLRMPDTAALLLILAASGARLDVRVAGVSILLNAASLAILLGVDLTVRRDAVLYGAKDIAIFGIYFVVATLFALGSARGVRAIAQETARAALVAQRARVGLRDLLRDHHDVRSSLSSARVRLEALAPRLAEADRALAAGLTADLDEVARMVGATRDRAYKEIAELDDPQPVEVAEVARSVVSVLGRRFSDVAFTLEADPLRALVVGGAQGLARVLLNVLVNAREGDGTRGATKAQVVVRKGESGRVAIEVTDDGPGFPDAVLQAPTGAFVSTKEEGSGFGMFLVASLVDASGGTLERENAAAGARVRIVLSSADE
jgi:signal transduction histidine kinase